MKLFASLVPTLAISLFLLGGAAHANGFTGSATIDLTEVKTAAELSSVIALLSGPHAHASGTGFDCTFGVELKYFADAQEDESVATAQINIYGTGFGKNADYCDIDLAYAQALAKEIEQTKGVKITLDAPAAK